MKFNKEHEDFMVSYVPGHHYKEIQEAFYKEFGIPITINQVKGYIGRNHLNTGFNGQFKKGLASFNKGKKQTEFMSPEAIENSKKTRFKKGQKPINYKPVGSTRKNVDGYIEIKTADPKTWVLMSRYVWESANGKCPKGYCLIHKNGLKDDDRLENLMLLSRAELARLNQSGLYSQNLDLNEVAINLARLNNKIGQRKRGDTTL